MDHNKHYDYFRRLSLKEFSKENDVYYLIHANNLLVKPSMQDKIRQRIDIERKLIRISKKNNEFLIYFKNRLLNLFFSKYKIKYDKFKLNYIDDYFNKLCDNLKIPSNNVHYIDNINNNKDLIESINPDLMVVVGAPFIQSDILNIECVKINLHIGFLPNYRGIKTIEWAIINNDYDKIGYTIHELTSKLDQGSVISRRTINVDSSNYDLSHIYTSLYEKGFNDLIRIVKFCLYN